jgi:hypothetical protein
MLPLVRADLQALANLRNSPKGSRILRASVVSLLWMGFVSMLWGSGSQLALAYPEAGSRMPPRVDLIAGLLAPSLVLSIATALGFGRRQLLEHPSLELLLSAPIAPWRVLSATWLRVGCVAWLFGVAISGPALWLLTPDAEVDPIARAATIVAAVGGVALPTVAVLCGLQILLARFTGGRASRVVNVLLHLLVSIGFIGLVVFGLLAGDRLGAEGVAALGGRRYGLRILLEAPANLLVATLPAKVGGPIAPGLGVAALRVGATVAGAAALVLLLGATCYRSAYALARIDGSRRRANGRSAPSWPGGTLGVFWRKDVRQLVAQPRQALSLLVGPALAATIVHTGDLGVLVDGSRDTPPLPGAFGGAFVVLALWWLVALSVLPIPLLRIVQADARQWVLYRAAPIRPLRLLLAKAALPSVLVVFWPIATAVTVAALDGLTDVAGALLGIALALPAGLWLACWLVTIATWPWLFRPDEEAGGSASPRGSLGVFVGMLLLNLLAIPGATLWLMLLLAAEGEGPLAGVRGAALVFGVAGAVWGVALVCAVPALGFARRNMRALLRAEG